MVEKVQIAPPRLNMLSAISGGAFQLRHVSLHVAPPKAPTANKNLAVAAILSNRKLIAGDSDSDSVSSESDDDSWYG